MDSRKVLVILNEIVPAFMFLSDFDSRDGELCEIFSRDIPFLGSSGRQPAFNVRFLDGFESSALGFQLSPWYPVEA